MRNIEDHFKSHTLQLDW